MDDIHDLISKIGNREILIRVMELENGLSIFVSSSTRPRLGLIAVATPPSQGRTNPSSSGLFGANPEITLVRTIAERVSLWTAQSCLVVSSVKALDRNLAMEILRILKSHFLP